VFPDIASEGMPSRPRILAWTAGALGIIGVGLLDHVSGTELRVYPLYFGPIAIVAWHGRRRGTIVAAALSAGTWLAANMLAGMRFSTNVMWVANTLVHGTAFLFVGLLISALRTALRSARDLSRTDPLTRLRNSRAFYEDARPLLALCRRTKRPVTLAFIDLDHFKSVNDSQGHEAGDSLLREIARAVERSVRPSDLAARLGGDEFAVLLPELGAHEAAAALERLRGAVSIAAGVAPQVTASVGGITLLEAPPGLEDLIRRADGLMYAAKARGRNRVAHEVASSVPHAAPQQVSQPAG